jgi:hypothetical protein
VHLYDWGYLHVSTVAMHGNTLTRNMLHTTVNAAYRGVEALHSVLLPFTCFMQCF